MSNPNNPMDAHTDTMLNRVLDKITHVETNQAKTATVLEGLVDTMRSFRSDLTVVERKVYEGGKTQWGTIFGAVGAAFTIITLVGGIIAYAWFSDIADVSSKVSDLAKNFYEHEKAEGHPYAVVEKIEAIQRIIDIQVQSNSDKFDEILSQRQRELDKIEQFVTSSLKRIEIDVNDRINRLETDIKHHNAESNKRLIDVEKRTGVLFKEGSPY